ncbi:MAG: hypothetical protein WBP81_11675 [Solirubrobacteraceae bacterium]
MSIEVKTGVAEALPAEDDEFDAAVTPGRFPDRPRGADCVQTEPVHAIDPHILGTARRGLSSIAPHLTTFLTHDRRR